MKSRNKFKSQKSGYSEAFKSVMNKRPNKLQETLMNKSREIKVDNMNKSNSKSFISDTNSNVSRLFPHVTKRRADNKLEATLAYTNLDRNTKLPTSLNTIENIDLKAMPKNSKSNSTLKFVFN